MYRFNGEDPGQSLYTPTTVGVIKQKEFHSFCVSLGVKVVVKYAATLHSSSSIALCILLPQILLYTEDKICIEKHSSHVRQYCIETGVQCFPVFTPRSLALHYILRNKWVSCESIPGEKSAVGTCYNAQLSDKISRVSP